MLFWPDDLHIDGTVDNVDRCETQTDDHHQLSAGGFLSDKAEEYGEKIRPGITEEYNAERHGEIPGLPDEGDGQGHTAEGEPGADQYFQEIGYDVDPHLILPAKRFLCKLQEDEDGDDQYKP